MYFIAVMECHGEAYRTFGAIDRNSVDFVVRVNLDLRADGNHASYEKQGIVQENLFLILVFLGIMF